MFQLIIKYEHNSKYPNAYFARVFVVIMKIKTNITPFDRMYRCNSIFDLFTNMFTISIVFFLILLNSAWSYYEYLWNTKFWQYV